MSEIFIRRMTRADLQAVALLDQMSFSLPWPPSAFGRELETLHSRCWVAETTLEAALTYPTPIPQALPELTLQAGEKAVVGMLVLWKILDEAHIATVAVHPQFRKQGIGRQLMIASLQAAAAEGVTSALLEVRAGNTTAIRLYEQLGFQVVGRRPHYYKDNDEDALLMTLPRLYPLMSLSSQHSVQDFSENFVRPSPNSKEHP